MALRYTVLLSLTACVIDPNHAKLPQDLEQSTEITKPRLLAIQAEPAEPRPGDVVRFRALLADPNNEIDTELWLVCPAPDDGVGFGCIGDDAEVVGVLPFQPPIYTTPTNILTELTEDERREGLYINVQVTGLPPIDPADLTDGFDFESIDFNQIEAGYKRIVVSEASTPNHNPVLLSMFADNTILVEGTILEVDAGQRYNIGSLIDEGTIETYEFLNRSGVVEQRVEEPYISWYATSGEVIEPVTLYPYLVSTWQAPDSPNTDGTIYAVVRDRRGGQNWLTVPFHVR